MAASIYETAATFGGPSSPQRPTLASVLIPEVKKRRQPTKHYVSSLQKNDCSANSTYCCAVYVFCIVYSARYSVFCTPTHQDITTSRIVLVSQSLPAFWLLRQRQPDQPFVVALKQVQIHTVSLLCLLKTLSLSLHGE